MLTAVMRGETSATLASQALTLPATEVTLFQTTAELSGITLFYPARLWKLCFLPETKPGAWTALVIRPATNPLDQQTQTRHSDALVARAFQFYMKFLYEIQVGTLTIIYVPPSPLLPSAGPFFRNAWSCALDSRFPKFTMWLPSTNLRWILGMSVVSSSLAQWNSPSLCSMNLSVSTTVM